MTASTARATTTHTPITTGLLLRSLTGPTADCFDCCVLICYSSAIGRRPTEKLAGQQTTHANHANSRAVVKANISCGSRVLSGGYAPRPGGDSPPHGIDGLAQRRHELVALQRAARMAGIDGHDLRLGYLIRQPELVSWRDHPVAQRNQHRRRRVDPADPRSRVEPGDLGDRAGDPAGARAPHLVQHPLQVMPDITLAVGGRCRRQPGPWAERLN